jgi:hypothetical protein
MHMNDIRTLTDSELDTVSGGARVEQTTSSGVLGNLEPPPILKTPVSLPLPKSDPLPRTGTGDLL